MKAKNNDLGRDPVGKLLMRLSVPAITAQLVNALYNIVDRIYIGHMEPDGDLALTGLGVCFAIIMFISALAALVSRGGAARAAIRMGEKDLDGADAILGSCTALTVVISLAVTIAAQIWLEPLLFLVGASEYTIGYAMDYLRIYLWGTISVQVALGLNGFVSTQGYSTVSMLTVLIGAVSNIILDPIFIFGLNMGVKGAALATVISQTISAVWVVIFLSGKRSMLKIRRKYLKLSGEVLRPVIALGVSPFVMQSTESLVSIAFNTSLLKYGGDPYVGAMTICSSVMQLFSMPLHGLGQGAQPIQGYNYGAGQMDRVRKTFKLLLMWSLACSVTLELLVQIFPGVFVALFNDKPEFTAVAVSALRIYSAGLFMFGIQCACQQTFMALGQAKVSLLMALLRKIILLIPLIYILPPFFEDKTFAVLLSEPVADICAATVTGIVFFTQFPRILKQREELLNSGKQKQ